MTLQQLKYVITVAAKGTISEAAKVKNFFQYSFHLLIL